MGEAIYMLSNASLAILSVIGVIGIVYLKNIAILAILVYLWVIVAVENKRHRLKNRVYKVIEKEKVVK